ncbi:MAG: hypothetical protein DRN59_00735 [Thaumarchaeota archaeon]|nr:MAG: hypothetical protein DRN59_00735 [Nitrososphaerota archaeon]
MGDLNKQEIIEEIKYLLSEIDVKKWLRLLRGIVIFVISILVLTYVTDYVLHYKIEMVFGFRGFEAITPKIPEFESIMAARGIQALITFFIIALTIALVAMFTGKDLNLVKMLTLIFHSFIIVAIFTSLQAPFILQVPKASFVIIDASMENVTFKNASLVGLTPSGEIHISGDVVRVAYLRVFKAYPNLTIPDWTYLEAVGLGDALEKTLTYMNMSGVSWIKGGEEMTFEKVDLCRGNWSEVSYERLLTRTPIRIEKTIPFQEYMLSIFSLLSTLGLVIYNTAGFKKMYNASWKATILVGLIMFILLFFFGSF